MMTTQQKIDAIVWFKRWFGLGISERFRANRLCPVCGSWSCAVSHGTHEYGRLRPGWVCDRCHNSGVGVFSLVRALTKGTPTLAAAARWLEGQGVTISPEVLETGHGIFPLGEHGANLMAHQEAARRASARKEQNQVETQPTTEARIAALETELAALKAARAKK
ncbi:MAG: hypothetical protein GXY07_18965 [Candidatus Hydrogenedentes bacterium]|nr:hypothetical protein [Candidatus Hydrogenedentota bacterium]